MSPSSRDALRTPDRRSSSAALFSAFRSLTSGRLKSPTPPPSISSATGTPARSSSRGTAHRPASIASAPAAIANGAPRHLSPQIGANGGRAPVGGPPELEEFVTQMHVSRPFPDRAAAAHRICSILEEYPVRNVMGLWAAASDLLLQEQSDEAAEVGYMLLKSCVAQPDLTPVERNVFFSAALLRPGYRHFDRRLDIISTLTNSGRTVEACESLIAPFILSSLNVCYKESRFTKQPLQGKKSADHLSKEDENLAKLFQYTIDLCKFNAKIFTDDDLDMLLRQAMVICQGTTKEVDIQNAIKLFDTVITYVHIPSNALKPCLEVLCAIHRQLKGLQEQTWNTLSNLFRSHIGQAAVSALLHTLIHGPERKSHLYSLRRGAIEIIQKLLLEDGESGLPRVPMSLLLPALKVTLVTPYEKQDKFILGFIATILAEEKVRAMLMEETDWTDLIEIIQTCIGRVEDQEVSQEEKQAAGKAIPASDMGVFPAGGEADLVTSQNSDVDTDLTLNGDAHWSLPHRTNTTGRSPDDDVSKILIALDAMSVDLETVQKAAVMELFMRLLNRLSDSIADNTIKFYVEEHYFQPSNERWLEDCRSLVAGILKDATRPRSLRLLSVKTLRNTYGIIESICAKDTILQCATLLLNNIEAEEDVEVLQELVNFAVDVADGASHANFSRVVEMLKRRLERPRIPPSFAAASPPPWISSAFQTRMTEHRLGSPCNVITTAFVRLFIRTVTKSARKTRTLYETLRYIIGSDACESDARLTAMKLLFRLRADSNHALIVSPSSEGETIAAILCRTAETAVLSEKIDDGTSSESGKPEDQLSWRDQRKASGSSPHSSLNRNTGRNTSIAGRVFKPIPPLWMYPGPKGLPEEPSSQPSRVVFAHVDAEEYPLSDDILDLEVTLWLELIISLLQKAPDWEIYSYALVHLGPQLSNQALVRSCVPQLKMLRSVVCEHLRNSTFHEPPSYTLLKKADVAVCLYHILTMLISYHDHFEKSEEDDMVKTFLHGMGHWDRTSKWCIHAITVCCQETPLSVSKSLDSIIQKMSQIITKPLTAIHILEFLASLARMPELYKNFRDEDFKMVFGVCFRYLQHVRDQRDRPTANIQQSGHRTLRHSGASRDFTASPDLSSSMASKIDEDLPQYVYSLAYHVITYWFMGLKMEDRRKQILWITKSLLYTDSTGKQVMEEQGQVIVDMMNMVAYTDRNETTRNPNFAKPGDGEIWRKTWIVGHSLITIETAARTGASSITTRRPCGTKYLYARPELASTPRYQVPITVGPASEGFYTSSYVGILPDDIFQTFYAPLNLQDPPVCLPDDQMTRRSIETFDRSSAIDSHKVGIIYIGEGQMGQASEKAILMNDIGSAAYTSFLDDLGTLVRLKGATFNTGGLDKNDDMDGEFTYCWRDRCIEIVFHITTMMRTDPDIDMTYASKKRHIGNDYVNMIFNDSGLPYDFNTFPSAFNYVAIVISPESRASFVDRRLDTDPDGKNRYYKVQVMSKPGFPDISPAVEPKILCGKHLAAYCRLLAINASVFSSVWAIREGGESISSWRNRLREIKRLRERYGASDMAMVTSSPSSPVQQHNMSSPSPRDNHTSAPGFKRTSVATFISEGTNRSSVTSSSQDAAQ